jgi:predicted phosphoribosyltransferase
VVTIFFKKIKKQKKPSDIRLAVPGVNEAMVARLADKVEKEVALCDVTPRKAVGKAYRCARAIKGNVVQDLSSRIYICINI